MKKNKGITLVALIITIIVMVILAGVIITAAVADGGIIDRAQEAMKQKERTEAEELVIASYVYKTTASMTTVGTLNLEATADAIYENLTSNGFTLMDGNVEARSGSDIWEGNKIELDIVGKYGNYIGTVTEKGLVGEFIIKNNNNNNNSSSNLTVSSQIINYNKVALKAIVNIGEKDNKAILEEYIEKGMGTKVDLDQPQAWIDIATYLSYNIMNNGKSFLSEENAREYINKEVLGLENTQTKEETISSLLILAANIKVNETEYNIQDKGYLIELKYNKINKIEVSFGDLTEVIEIELKSDLLTYGKNYTGNIKIDGFDEDVPISICLNENLGVALGEGVLVGNVPYFYNVDTNNEKLYINNVGQLGNTIEFGIGENKLILNTSMELTQNDGTIEKISIAGELELENDDTNNLFAKYAPEKNNITDTTSKYYNFNNGIYAGDNIYLYISINVREASVGTSNGKTSINIQLHDIGVEEMTEYLLKNKITVDNDGNVYYNGKKLELIENFN